MANRAVLSIVSPSARRDLLFGRYTVPAFWLACLDAGALRREALEHDDDGDTSTFFLENAGSALARCRGRADALEGVLGDVSAQLAAWTQQLTALGDAVLCFDVTEIVSMTADGDAQLTEALRFLDAPTEPGAIAFLAMTSLRDVMSAGAPLRSTSPQGRPLLEYLIGTEHP